MTLATWNCFSIPFTVAFVPEMGNELSIVIINSIIDFVFVLDVILNFRTSYFSAITGDEISEPKMIAKNYL